MILRLSLAILMSLAATVSVVGAALAAETVVPQPKMDAVTLANSLPEPVLKRLRRNPASYIAAAAEAISTYGGKAGLDAAAIDRFVAIDRAKVRAREVERLLRADLDNDTVIVKAEFETLMGIATGGSKVRLTKAWQQSDLDHNDKVDAAELNAYAQSVALSEVSEVDADGWRALLLFDLDASGFVRIDEVIAAVATLQSVDMTRVRKEI